MATARRETIFELPDTGATARTSTATAANIADRASTVIDHRFDVAVRGGMADANQH
jgi:hypothetical protein